MLSKCLIMYILMPPYDDKYAAPGWKLAQIYSFIHFCSSSWLIMTAWVTWECAEMRDAKAKNDLNYYILLRSSNIGYLGEMVASERLTYQ